MDGEQKPRKQRTPREVRVTLADVERWVNASSTEELIAVIKLANAVRDERLKKLSGDAQ